MDELLKQALIQAPILTIVLGYLYFNNREWRDYLRERNGKLEHALDKLSAAIEKLSDK